MGEFTAKTPLNDVLCESMDAGSVSNTIPFLAVQNAAVVVEVEFDEYEGVRYLSDFTKPKIKYELDEQLGKGGFGCVTGIKRIRNTPWGAAVMKLAIKTSYTKINNEAKAGPEAIIAVTSTREDGLKQSTKSMEHTPKDNASNKDCPVIKQKEYTTPNIVAQARDAPEIGDGEQVAESQVQPYKPTAVECITSEFEAYKLLMQKLKESGRESEKTALGILHMEGIGNLMSVSGQTQASILKKGEAAIVMERYQENLDSYVKKMLKQVEMLGLTKVPESYTIQFALELFIRMIAALEFTHSCGIVHRDVKPTNTLINSKNGKLLDVVLIDYGVAMFDGSIWTSGGRMTMNFDSLNITATGARAVPRDDLESALFTFYYVAKLGLPWQCLETVEDQIPAKKMFANILKTEFVKFPALSLVLYDYLQDVRNFASQETFEYGQYITRLSKSWNEVNPNAK